MVLIGSERFAEACKLAREEIDFPTERSFAVGKVDGFRPFSQLSEGQPDTLPEDRSDESDHRRSRDRGDDE